MPFKYIKYEDSEGSWFCPIDENNKVIYNNHRFDAKAFLAQWKEGCVFSVDEPGHFGKLLIEEDKK